MKKISFVIFICLFLALGGCADSIDSHIDAARFALDRCNPGDSATSSDCTAGITNAEAAINDDATNLEAYTLASSGYFGRAQLDLLDLVQTFSELQDSTEDDYVVIADVATIPEANLPDLASSESVLSASPATFNNHAYFQLGMIEALEAFILPISRTKSTGGTAPLLITADDRTRVENDYLNGDNNLASGGVESSNDVVQNLRENFCRLKIQTVGDEPGQAFSLVQLQDQIGCVLDATSYVPQLDYNEDGGVPTTADCTAFAPSGDAVTTCKAQDTSIN